MKDCRLGFSQFVEWGTHLKARMRPNLKGRLKLTLQRCRDLEKFDE
ncbi:hypothetical protein ACOBQJ_07585 [Pelotomaculum propionicicum]